MATLTYENHRLRVIVDTAIVDRYRVHADHAARISREDPEKTLRGIILSEAMSILGNASQVKILERDPVGTSPREVMALAVDLLTLDHIEREGKYDYRRVAQRMAGNHPMSSGMSVALSRGRAYAQGVLRPLSALAALGKHPPRNWCAQKNVLLTMSGNRARATAVLDEAYRLIECRRGVDLRYRRAHARTDGWDITILDAMPRRIGLCDFDLDNVLDITRASGVANA